MDAVTQPLVETRVDYERLTDQQETHEASWLALSPDPVQGLVLHWLQEPADELRYLELRSSLVPLLLTEPQGPARPLAELLLYVDLHYALELPLEQIPAPSELEACCQDLEARYLQHYDKVADFELRDYPVQYAVALPSDIYADSTAEAHALARAIDDYNRDFSEDKARAVLDKALRFKTLDADDRCRLLCFLITEPNLQLHQWLARRIGRPCGLLERQDPPALVEGEWSIDAAKQRLRSAYNEPALHTAHSQYPRVSFQARKPALSMQQGCMQSELFLVLNIFTGKITAHTDLVAMRPHRDPSLYAIAEVVWRQIQNGSLELDVERSSGIKQLAEDLESLLFSFGAQCDEHGQVNLQNMDPHLITLKAIEHYVCAHFRELTGTEPQFIASVVCHNLLGLIAQSRPMDSQVLGIGADHDGSVTFCHTENARFYAISLGSAKTQRSWERCVRRHAEFLQGPLQSMMSAGQAIKPEVIAALIKGGCLNLAFTQRELEELLFQAMLAAVCSDLLPNSLDLFSHQDEGRHKQYSKTRINGREVLVESPRGCFRENGEATPYAIHPGCLWPVPFNTPSSEACASLGVFTNPFNPGEHRSAQHGLQSGTPLYRSQAHEPGSHRDPDSKGQTLYLNREQHHELKGFMPNNLIKAIDQRAHSCSSFVLLMLHTAYIQTHANGFDIDMDVLRNEFRPEEPFEDAPIDLTLDYPALRQRFQDLAIELIEAIWAPCLEAPEVRERFESDVLPYLLLVQRGERLSRPELCKLRMLSQLHCLGRDQQVARLGRFINWFFPPATRKSATHLRALLREAWGCLKATAPYKQLMQAVKQRFDISPMRSSPGLLLDHFERQRLTLKYRGPQLLRYMRLVNQIVSRSLASSCLDPHGIQTDPSQVRARLIDMGPKSIGSFRRIMQAVCTPIQLIVRLFSARANNRAMVSRHITQLGDTRICFSAEAPQPSWRSQQVQAFEALSYGQLCDLATGSLSPDDFLQQHTEQAQELHNIAHQIHQWKQPFHERFSQQPHLDRALAKLRLRSLTEKSLKKDLLEAQKALDLSLEEAEDFTQLVYTSVDRLREAMLLLKTHYLDVNMDLCGHADQGQQESTRGKNALSILAFRQNLAKQELAAASSWAQGLPLPEQVEVNYNALQKTLRGSELAHILTGLSALHDAVVEHCPELKPLAVLDFCILNAFLRVLNLAASPEALKDSCCRPPLRPWLDALFSRPGEDILEFMQLFSRHERANKAAMLRVLVREQVETAQCRLVLDYLIKQAD